MNYALDIAVKNASGPVVVLTGAHHLPPLHEHLAPSNDLISLATLHEGSRNPMTRRERERSSYILLFREPEVPEKLLLDDGARGLRALFENSGLDGDAEEYVRLMSEPGAMTAALNWYRAADFASFGAIGPITMPTLFVLPR